ncbi:hypothetical protein HYX16_03390 [Candidatus Woesearchaeota archaeon]|nr:hypothetical protein [Candidatus Woesearchaeota archaeon]
MKDFKDLEFLLYTIDPFMDELAEGFTRQYGLNESIFGSLNDLAKEAYLSLARQRLINQINQKLDIIKKKREKKDVIEIHVPKKENETKELSPDFSRFSKEQLTSFLYDGRIDELSSFAILGIDVKITPDNEVKIIEVNGANMGMAGFVEACAEYDNLGKLRIDDDSGLWKITEEGILINPYFRYLCDHLCEYGLASLSYTYKLLGNSGVYSRNIASAINYKLDIFDSFAEEEKLNLFKWFLSNDFENDFLKEAAAKWGLMYNDIAIKLSRTERILSNKLLTDIFFENIRNVKPKTYPYTEERYRELIEKEKPKYVVVKPNYGFCGNEMRIIDPKTASLPELDFKRSFAAESFAESKPILSLHDGKYHDGCMRYVTVAEENKQGNIKLYHFGGYWRLCPKEISKGIDMDAMRANLAKKAVPLRVDDEDLQLVKETIDENIPMFYRELTGRIN